MSSTDPIGLPRCWTEEDLCIGLLELSASEARHLEKVRRVQAGDPVCVLNGRGHIGFAILKKGGGVHVQEVTEVERSAPRISLYLGALKQNAWDEVLKHATELGVSRIVRVESAHAVSRLEGKAERKAARWRDLLIEACKQSANPWLPELALMGSVEQACSDPSHPERGWVAQLGGETVSPGKALEAGLYDELAVWVGPEGDFSEQEMQRIREKGMIPVTLGPRVLRAETAALSLLSRLQLHG